MIFLSTKKTWHILLVIVGTLGVVILKPLIVLFTFKCLLVLLDLPLWPLFTFTLESMLVSFLTQLSYSIQWCCPYWSKVRSSNVLFNWFHHLKTSSNLSQFLFIPRKISFIKAIKFHQIMVQHLQSCTTIYSLSCSKNCLRLSGIPPNEGVITKEQNEYSKEIEFMIDLEAQLNIILRKYLSHTQVAKGFLQIYP